jgi:ferredoxin-NADP reductase
MLLLILLAAVLLPPVVLYAISAWVPGFSDADMAGDDVLTRLVDISGLVSMSAILVAILLIVRLRVLTRRVAHPELQATHRLFGLLAASTASVHVSALALQDPSGTLHRLEFVHAPDAARAGVLALLALLFLGLSSRMSAPPRTARRVTSDFRERRCATFRARHPDLWRRVHSALALAAVAATSLHIYFLGHMMDAVWYRRLFLVLVIPTAAAILWRYAVRPLRRNTAWRVRSVTRRTDSILTLTLRAPVNADIPGFTAGQFAYLRLTRVPTASERPFTISSSPHSPGDWEFTIRISDQPKSFSQSLLKLRKGDQVYVDGPHGTLGAEVTDPATQGMVAVTSGVGITPALSLLRTLAVTEDTRDHRLMLAFRTTADILTFRPQLSELQSGLDLKLRYSQITQGVYGDTVATEELLAFLPETNRDCFDYVLCGPASFVTNIWTLLVHQGIPKRRIHTETILSAGPAPLGPPPVLPQEHPSAPGKAVSYGQALASRDSQHPAPGVGGADGPRHALGSSPADDTVDLFPPLSAAATGRHHRHDGL